MKTKNKVKNRSKQIQSYIPIYNYLTKIYIVHWSGLQWDDKNVKEKNREGKREGFSVLPFSVCFSGGGAYNNLKPRRKQPYLRNAMELKNLHGLLKSGIN